MSDEPAKKALQSFNAQVLPLLGQAALSDPSGAQEAMEKIVTYLGDFQRLIYGVRVDAPTGAAHPGAVSSNGAHGVTDADEGAGDGDPGDIDPGSRAYTLMRAMCILEILDGSKAAVELDTIISRLKQRGFKEQINGEGRLETALEFRNKITNQLHRMKQPGKVWIEALGSGQYKIADAGVLYLRRNKP